MELGYTVLAAYYQEDDKHFKFQVSIGCEIFKIKKCLFWGVVILSLYNHQIEV